MASDLPAGDTEDDILADCQDAIGYRFQTPALLRGALTHVSGANTRGASNERMEFLGDAVLGLVCCEQLYLRFPDYQEGDLTTVKSAVVSRKACARIGQRLGLDEFLFSGKGMAHVPDNVMADLYESLVGAIFLDGGLEPAKAFVLSELNAEIDAVAGGNAGNHKSQLQQVAQRELGDTPKYRVLDEQGPDHDKAFKVAAEISRTVYPAAWGKTKREAEQRAAKNAIAYIRNEDLPHPADF